MTDLTPHQLGVKALSMCGIRLGRIVIPLLFCRTGVDRITFVCRPSAQSIPG